MVLIRRTSGRRAVDEGLPAWWVTRRWDLPWGSFTAATIAQDAGSLHDALRNWEAEAPTGRDDARGFFGHIRSVLHKYEALRFPIRVFRGLDSGIPPDNDLKGGGWFWSMDPTVAAKFSAGGREGKRRGVLLTGLFTTPGQFTDADTMNYELAEYALFMPQPEWLLVGQPEQVQVIGGNPPPWVKL